MLFYRLIDGCPDTLSVHIEEDVGSAFRHCCDAFDVLAGGRVLACILLQCTNEVLHDPAGIAFDGDITDDGPGVHPSAVFVIWISQDVQGDTSDLLGLFLQGWRVFDFSGALLCFVLGEFVCFGWINFAESTNSRLGFEIVKAGHRQNEQTSTGVGCQRLLDGHAAFLLKLTQETRALPHRLCPGLDFGVVPELHEAAAFDIRLDLGDVFHGQCNSRLLRHDAHPLIQPVSGGGSDVKKCNRGQEGDRRGLDEAFGVHSQGLGEERGVVVFLASTASIRTGTGTGAGGGR